MSPKRSKGSGCMSTSSVSKSNQPLASARARYIYDLLRKSALAHLAAYSFWVHHSFSSLIRFTSIWWSLLLAGVFPEIIAMALKGQESLACYEKVNHFSICSTTARLPQPPSGGSTSSDLGLPTGGLGPCKTSLYACATDVCVDNDVSLRCHFHAP